MATVELVIDQRQRDLGGGLTVGRILPSAKRRMVGPFVFLDHMGPVNIPAGTDHALDVRPHPHVGLSTVTYLFSGEVVHRDSLGYVETIRPGEVNWMTAGRGITHSERFEKARLRGDMLHGMQAWVALPNGKEEVEPSFSHHDGADLPQWNRDGVTGRLIAGGAYGLHSQVRTYSPMFYVHLDLECGASANLPDDYPERAIYVVSGSIMLGGTFYNAGKMLILGRGATKITAKSPTTVMLLGGKPIGERFIYWNFVSSSKERLIQAAADWEAGRMPLPETDKDEYIPLPEDLPPIRA